MICPVDIASEMSALRAARVGDHGEHGLLLEGRGGAGDEGTGSDFAGHGEEDHVVAGGRDPRISDRHHAALAGALRGVWLRRAVRPAAGAAQPEAGSAGDGGAGFGAVPGAVFRFERAAFSREAAGGARHRTELHLGESRRCKERGWWRGGASAGCIGSGASGGRCRGCCCTSTAAAPLVAGRALVRLDRGSG